ncbi:tlde1 domain-containing protein [Burkholderia guangdongensis]|uniref:tlde1 domain-containing protein n=1 Tax=Burkholderia guangdongensis TaxID=1792500 RepID=UPI0015C8D153
MNKFEWFALYAKDRKIDDELFCDQVRRGKFRLHPKGPLGVSEGCITLEHRHDFLMLRSAILSAPKFRIPGTSYDAYGMVIVS